MLEVCATCLLSKSVFASLIEFFTKKTHTKHPLYDSPGQSCTQSICVCLCNITVVQVSRQHNSADRQACKRTAKHLCWPQRSLLSYNWLSCPTCGFSYKTHSSRRIPLHLPEGTKRTTEGCSPRGAAKWLPLSKACWMARGFLCELWDRTGTWRGQTGRKDKSGEEEKREAAQIWIQRTDGQSSLGFQVCVVWNCSNATDLKPHRPPPPSSTQQIISIS